MVNYNYPAEPMALRNEFREQTRLIRSLPAYSDAKSSLPVPVLPDHPQWVEMYWRAWEMAWSKLRRPEGVLSAYVQSNGDYLSWWDSAFMTQFGVYGRRHFDFMGMLDNFYAQQKDDGYICRLIHAETGSGFFAPFDPNGTGPNILGWAEWRYFRLTGDDGRLYRVFPPLLALHRWFRAHRTWPNGLYWATGLSSGMDNQPRVPDSKYSHRHWTWVDATMQAALNCSILGKMAILLKEEEAAAELTAEHERLVVQINANLWNVDAGFYQDLSPDGRFSGVKSVGAYWGLLDKELISADRKALFLRHLRESWAFDLPHRLPSQSADSDGYNSGGNEWRGGVWPSTNFMTLKGLRAADKHKLAHAIAVNHLENVHQTYARTDAFWSYYAPEAAEQGSSAIANAVQSAGLTAVSILIEEVIGIRVDWPLRRVIWDRLLDCNAVYGVENIPLGSEGTLTLLGDEDSITVTTDAPFTLMIRDSEQNLQTAVDAGATEIRLD